MKLDTDKMTATQRALAIINHEEPDRLPMYLMGFPPYSLVFKEFIQAEENIPEFEDESNIIITPLGDWTMHYYFGGEIFMYGVGCQGPHFQNLLLNSDGTLTDDPKAITQLESGTEGQYVNSIGCIHGFRILANGERYNWYIDGYLKKKEDALAWYDRWGWPKDYKVNTADLNAYEKTRKDFGDRTFVIPQIAGHQLYESTWPIMGQSRWGYYCRKDPDFIKFLIDDRKQCQLKILDQIKRLKPPIVFGGDDMGQKGRPLLSPDMFRKFLCPAYKEVFLAIHSMGAKAFNHSCGNIVELLPDYIEAGIDGWQSLEPASEIDHVALKQKFGDKLLLVGGIDSRVTSFGTPAEINAHVHKQILAMGKGGGYIPGPTHDFLTETSMKNALALRDAVIQWGKYPLV
jgi:hypothetical protein